MVRYLRSSALISGSIVCFSGVLAGGADPKKPEERPEQRQQAMLRDPMGYKTASERNEKYDISGGDMGHFDKDAFNKDLEHALNPDRGSHDDDDECRDDDDRLVRRGGGRRSGRHASRDA